VAGRERYVHEAGIFQLNFQLDLLVTQTQKFRVEVCDHFLHLSHNLIVTIRQSVMKQIIDTSIKTSFLRFFILKFKQEIL